MNGMEWTDDVAGLRFIYNRAHTVNVYRKDELVDAFSVGDFAFNYSLSFDEFVNECMQWLIEEASEQ